MMIRGPVISAPIVTVMTFNVLADGAAQTGEFVNCMPNTLAWNTRGPALVSHIRRRDPDLIALQECNQFEYFRARLSGYTGVFVPKVEAGDADGGFGDGVAIFWRSIMFEPIGAPLVSHKQGENAVSLVVFLKYFLSGKTLTFATTHLKAKDEPENVALRGAQAANLATSLAAAGAAEQPHVLVVGDFNARFKSGKETCFKPLQALGLEKAFSMEWTTYKERELTDFDRRGRVKREIDHMFVSRRVVLVSHEDVPVIAELLPNESNPSDHLPLFAQFVLS